MTEEVIEEIDYQAQYGELSEENKKLKIDIASLQLSNRSLVNQNRDEKKKVMDCRLQIADLEGRQKTFDTVKQDLSDCQSQVERLRMTLESNEAKLSDAERRANEANSLIKVKDSVILKQSNFTKEIEESLHSVTNDRDSLLLKNNSLENELNEALIRGEDADDLRDKLKSLQEVFDKLSNDNSGVVGEGGLAAANEYFKNEQTRLEDRITELKDTRTKLEQTIDTMGCEKKDLQDQIEKQNTEYEKLDEKCTALETRIKEIAQTDRRYGGSMGSRLIGPTLPPWLADEKKVENDLERLSNLDPAALRAKVMELENQVSELNELLAYREDVILRIHEEISRKAAKIESIDVEKSSLNAQISILKRELATARDDLTRRGGGGPPELESELERLRGKRDREYQRRKKLEAEANELEKANHEMRRRIKELEDTAPAQPPAPVVAKPVIPQSDPSDRQRIVELQNTVNQLRMDNEAKRSELFDVRSRLDSKSLQSDKAVAELKVKERSCAELTTQLNNTRSQLEAVNKELEDVRCRAVRGGAEAEQWHSDMTSVQVTNKFLSAQVNDMRLKLLAKERTISSMTNRLQQAVVQPVENGELSYDDRSTSHSTNEESKHEGISNGIDIIEDKSTETLPSETEAALNEASNRAYQLEQALIAERQSCDLNNSKVSELTVQINQLESSLSETRSQLLDCQAEMRKHDSESAAAITSPPTKRTRRSTSTSKSNANAQDCSSCGELRKQIQSLEDTITGCSSRESDLTDKAQFLSITSRFRLLGRSPILLHGVNSIGPDSARLAPLLFKPPANTLTSSQPVRGIVLRQIWATLRSKWHRKRPVLIGTDSFGNRYFESPPNKASQHSSRSSRPQRFLLVPGQKSINDPWQQLSGDLPEMPSEWHSWLYHQRKSPPTDEEIERNTQTRLRRRSLAAEVESKRTTEHTKMVDEGLAHKTGESPKGFPTYPGFETAPGEGQLGESKKSTD